MKKALFAVSSLGLGHATRSLPVIQRIKKEYAVTVLSWGKALEFLQNELGDTVSYLECEDYPKLERGEGWRFYFYLVKDLLETSWKIREEHRYMKALEKDFDLVIADGRYGFYSERAPSFLISHQISFVPPKGLGAFRFLTDLGNYLSFRRFDMVWIPDAAPYEKSLAGRLSHPGFLKLLRHRFIGILSSYTELDLPKDIDYLFIISGYLQEHKQSFVSRLLEAAKRLEGRKVFILGNPGDEEVQEIPESQITLYPVANGALRNELFNRAKTIISRTGYTTIMDLAELDKKAILFPTPHSTEQEYLARYHRQRNYFVIGEEHGTIDLERLSRALETTRSLPQIPKTEEALSTIETIIRRHLHTHFFTIVIPACNEEKYLDATLQKIARLHYDPDRYEIIVVENGSDDRTLEIAESWEEKLPNLTVIQSSPRGVSRAKNTGLDRSNPASQYTVFLDADTQVESTFLETLNTWINRHHDGNFVVGTTAVLPADSDRFSDRAWFALLNLGHRLSKTSFSIQIARTDIARDVRFDESLHYSEDLLFIKEMLVFGEFFYLDTDTVRTSTRRFRKEGYLKTLLLWSVQALTPYRMKKNQAYPIVR